MLKEMKFMNKPLVAITGASSDIGANGAEVFSDAGHSLLLIIRRIDRLKVLRLPNAVCCQHDVSDVLDYRAFATGAEQQYGKVDLLINNAGYMNLEHFKPQSSEGWRRQFEVNCVGTTEYNFCCLSYMIARGRGTIINVGSTSKRNIYDNDTAYNGTKHAVHAMSEGLRRGGAFMRFELLSLLRGWLMPNFLRSPRMMKF